MPDYAPLPLSKTETPASQDDLVELVRQAHHDQTPLYPIGGGTSLGVGLTPKQSGCGVVTKALQRVVDFPARDLTVTVEAGITLQALADLLSTENLQLPVDVPHPQRATLGGVIATAWSGPRRYGYGLIRDAVIGIRAVDGRGEVFNGGGRVVKNVAGYDFCKLLTGSLGMLGIISQVTLKLRPRPQQTTIFQVGLPSLEVADGLLTELNTSPVLPVAIDILSHGDQHSLFIILEGTQAEVAWQHAQLLDFLQQRAFTAQVVPQSENAAVLHELIHFPAVAAPLSIKATLRPSQTFRFAAVVQEIDPQAHVQIHAGSGIVYVRFSEFPQAGLARTLISKLQPLAAESLGSVVVLSNPAGLDATFQSTWGIGGAQLALQGEVKKQFDPRSILNPGRFL